MNMFLLMNSLRNVLQANYQLHHLEEKQDFDKSLCQYRWKGLYLQEPNDGC